MYRSNIYLLSINCATHIDDFILFINDFGRIQLISEYQLNLQIGNLTNGDSTHDYDHR